MLGVADWPTAGRWRIGRSGLQAVDPIKQPGTPQRPGHHADGGPESARARADPGKLG